MKNYVITIERGFGSGGKTIGCEISQKLGIPCYTDEILQMASEESGLSAELFEKMNHKNRNGNISKQFSAIRKSVTVSPEEGTRVVFQDENLFNYQAQVIRALAINEPCVILGYCANFILRTFPNVLAVNIQAPYHICTDEIADRYVMSKEEAAVLVADTDTFRSSYYKYFTGRDWTNYKDYDIIMNSYRLGRENCADQIIELLNKKMAVK